MKFVLSSKTNKNKTTEIFPPLLLKPTDIRASAMPRVNKGQQKVSILKRATELYPSRSYYTMLLLFCILFNHTCTFVQCTSPNL